MESRPLTFLSLLHPTRILSSFSPFTPFQLLTLSTHKPTTHDPSFIIKILLTHRPTSNKPFLDHRTHPPTFPLIGHSYPARLLSITSLQSLPDYPPSCGSKLGRFLLAQVTKTIRVYPLPFPDTVLS